MADPNASNPHPAKTLGRWFARLLIMSSYYLAIAAGLLFVLYHLFFMSLSTPSSYMFSHGTLFALMNLVYAVAIVVLISVKAWRACIHKPWVSLLVLLTIPALLYLNYILVERLTPYSGYNL